MVCREKINFGRDVWIDGKALLPAVSAKARRQLTDDEKDELYRAINEKFEEEYSSRSEVVTQWRSGDFTHNLSVDLHVSDSIRWINDAEGCGTVHVLVRKNTALERRCGKYKENCPEFIAEVTYGRRSIKDFHFEGSPIRYRKFAYQNLFEALKLTGKIVSPGCGWTDLVVQNLLSGYDNLQADRTKTCFLLPTGMTCRLDAFDEYLPGSSIDLLFVRKDSGEWDILIVVGGDADHPKTIEECVPRIYAKVDRMVLQRSTAIADLAQKADYESWKYKGDAYGALKIYLESVYDRLFQESIAGDKRVFLSPKEDESAMVFCTGLVTSSDNGSHYIYAYCSSPNEDGIYQKIEWMSSMQYDSSSKLVFEDTSIHHGLPYPPHWVLDSNRLLFDYRYGSITERQIGFNLPHLYVNLRQRLPGSAKEQFCRKFRSEAYNRSIEHDFKEYLYSAWRETRKILQKSFKVAIPTYYRGKIQLLVPLYLDENDRGSASVALVVALNEKIGVGEPHYICPTCLSLDMARIDSRVITRIDDTWLS